MRTPIISFALTAFLATAGVGNGATAEYMLTGVFCNTEQGIIAVFNDRRAGLSVEQSMAARNAHITTCFVAGNIKYLASSPVRIGQVGAFGAKYTRYRATFLGVVVDGNIIKFDEPLATYFVRYPNEVFLDEMVELSI